MKRKTIYGGSTVLMLLLMQAATSHTAQGQLFISEPMYIGSGDTVAVSSHTSVRNDIDGSGALLLNGDTMQSLDFSGHTLYTLVLDNQHGTSLLSDLAVRNGLHLATGHLKLNEADFIFHAGAGHSGAKPGAFLVTNGTGMVVAQSVVESADFHFPVGSTEDQGDYTPATVMNDAAVRDISLQVKNYAQSEAVVHREADGMDRVWEIYSDIEGDATITLQHNVSTEGASFVRQDAFITRQLKADGSEWSVNSPAPSVDDKIHTGSFSLSGSQTENRFFSKSSNSEFALGLSSVTVKKYAEVSDAWHGYPNPFTSDFQVAITANDHAGELPYMILDAVGKTVKTGTFDIQPGTNKFRIQMGSLPAGNYILRCYTEDSEALVLRMTKQ